MSPARAALRRFVVGGLEASGALPALRRREDRTRAAILRYHSVSEFTDENDLYRCPTIAVTPETFERQMRFLAREYRVVPLDDLAGPLGRGEPLPSRAVAITFDDGYHDNFRLALPILRGLGLPATVYVVSDAIGAGSRFWVARLRAALVGTPRIRLDLGPELGRHDLGTRAARHEAVDRLTRALKAQGAAGRAAALERVLATAADGVPAGAEGWIMDWPHLHGLVDAGLTIGAHTRTHPILTRLTAEEAAAEIRGSREALERGLGRPVLHFAYPNGGGVLNHDEGVAALVRAAGFASATTSVNGPVRTGDDPFRLRRLGVSERHALDGFAFNLERDRLFRLGAPAAGVRPALILVGPPRDARGGIATCVNSFLGSSLGRAFAMSQVSPTGPRAPYELGPFGKGAALAGALCAFTWRLARSRPAAVQVHASHYGDFWRNAPFLLLSAAFRVPSVLMIHGSRFDRFWRDASFPRRRLIRFLLRRPRAVLVRGDYWKNVVEDAVPGQRVEVFPTTTDPVEVVRPAVDVPAEPVVLFVGGSPLVEDAVRKGLPDLLAVVPDVLAQVPGARFRIVGPRLEPPWTDALSGLTGSERVEFLGTLPRERVLELYRSASLFVLPSYAEGMPNVVLEAMAQGLPVVSTEVGSTPEVVEEGQGGRLVPAGDRSRLAQAIVAVLADREVAARMGEHNRALVRDRFGNREAAERLLALYRSLLGPRGSP